MRLTYTTVLEIVALSYWTIEWIIRVWAFFVVPVNRKPTAALGWLMVIMLFPVLGFLAFKLIGSPKLPPKRRENQKLAAKFIHEAIEQFRKNPKTTALFEHPVGEEYESLERLGRNLGGLPALPGNAIELIHSYGEVFARLEQDIIGAKRFIHLEFYIVAWDQTTEPLLRALAKAVERGVKVRLLYDQYGSRKYPGYTTLRHRLETLGIEVYPMLPVHIRRQDFTRPDLRNHRKIGVIDAEIAYTGSLNLIDRSYHRSDGIRYDELVARVEGPVVAEFEAVFATDWFAESGQLLAAAEFPELTLSPKRVGDTFAQVLPSGPAHDTENNLKLFGQMIHAAKHSLTIVNPYFVPDESLMVAITSAANRGVRVRLINSAVSDQFLVSKSQRSYYGELLAAGVEIYLYEGPNLLHSKTITVDDTVAVVGSSNFDMRSFTLNLEVTLVVYDPTVVRSLQKIEDGYLKRSRRVQRDEWEKRGRGTRLAENIARLTSAVQ